MTLAAVPSETQVKTLLAQIHATHRVLWPDGAEADLKLKLSTNPDLEFVWETVHHAADGMLDQPLVKRELIGRRLLDKSRLAFKRLVYLGMSYRITGDRRYADRAIVEMRNIAGFSDWHPPHFLDVAEMTAGMAIGLDWCRDAMNAADIALVQKAIVEKGLKPSLDPANSWIHGENNWNQVCHDGAVLGALAVSDVEQDLAAKVIVSAVDGLPYAMKNYAPDGAYPEGAGYWAYGTTYNALGLTAMQAALGTDFGLSQQPGFLKTGDYMLNIVGPTGFCFNYSDSGWQTLPEPFPAKFFFAKLTGNDSLVYPDRIWLEDFRTGVQKKKLPANQYLPLLLLWAGASGNQPPTGLHYVASGITPVAAYRTGWDKQASFIAFKGGSPSSSHAHMDVGAIVVDALGERWVDCLGMQDYESLERLKVDLWNMKQNSQRWQVFRLGPMSQNILTVNDQPQRVTGHATLIKSTDHSSIVDLRPVYEGQLASARRGIILQPHGTMLLRDQITAADSPATVRFALLTRAQIQLDPDGATLTRNGKTMKLTVTGVSNLHMETYSTVGPQSYDAKNPDTQMLGFKVALTPGQAAAWDVQFIPQGKIAEPSPGDFNAW